MSDPGCDDDNDDQDTYVLVEGPTWGDAEFYGHWLLTASKANRLLQDAKRDDPEFRAAIFILEVLYVLDFGIMATVFLSQFTDERFYTFAIEVGSSDDLNEFALMVEMGFFNLTGDRYQMTVPENLDLKRVKEAHLRLAATEDEDGIHPEKLVVGMPRSQARRYERLLSSMNQDQRLADRRALLFND